MDGEYKETLPFGVGDLVVTKKKFVIKFYFPGPDLRFNGTLFTVEGKEIDRYIDAYERNWVKYVDLKKMRSQLGGEFKTIGEQSMNIFVGGFFDGICITSYHMPIKEKTQLDRFVDSLKWAKDRGIEIQKILMSL